MNFVRAHFLIAVSAFLLICCLVIGISVAHFGPLPFDFFVSSEIVKYRTHFLTAIFLGFTDMASPISIYSISLLLWVFFLWSHRIRDAFVFTAAMLAGLFSYSWIKMITQIERPLDGLTMAAGMSYPSGHATIAFITFFLAAYFFSNDVKNVVRKELFFFTAAILVLLVALSRLYLGVHYASDVLGGLLLGAAITFCAIAFLRHLKN